ncbi:FAD/NAD(P)-binding domain-containing protein [Hypoxylon sp. FL0890]|nr:FAD/NAD(P)-binding domain-containing protein [Hypoxylon sp. FL0890]
MPDPPFRVIVIGAGPTGLYVGRALYEAKIDFIILEKAPPTFRERGNHLLIWPHTARLLHQIGLYDEAKRRSYKLASKRDMLSDGRTLNDYPIWQTLEDSHGYPMMPLQRCELLEILYEGLPNRKEVIKTGAKVTKIEAIDDGVQVHLEDGTVETGSVVIGADGIHGITRTYVKEMALKQNLSPPDNAPAEILTTSHFYSIYAEGPNKFGIESGVFFETRKTGMAIQLGTNTDMLRLIMYKKLPQPLTEQVQYTRQQMEEFAEEFFDMGAAPGVKLGDIWPDVYKDSARLVNQEEGFAGLWHTDRVVLTGDAAVTSSSVNGLGVNCGLHSTALLASELQKVYASSDGNPSAASLEAAFARYQRFRAKELRRIYDYGYMSMRQMTWDSWTDWFIDRFVKPWMPMNKFVNAYAVPMVRNGQILTYVPFKGFEGPVRWRWYPDACADHKS